MKLSTLFTFFFLLFLAIFSNVTWSPVDSQHLASIDPTAAGNLALFSGKIPLLLALGGLAGFSFRLGNPLRAAGVMPCVFLAMAAASTAWSVSPAATIFAVIQLTLVLGYPLLAIRILGLTPSIRIVWYFGTALIVASVALAVLHEPHALMGGIHEGRWRGLFPHKNLFGPFVITNILITIFAQQHLKQQRALIYAVIFIDLAALIGSQSASAFVAGIAGGISSLYFLQIRSNQLRRLWRFATIVTIIGCGALLFFQSDTLLRLLGRDPTLSSRTVMWDHAMELTFQRLIGTGYGTAGGSEVSLALQKLFELEQRVSVQSGFLNLALELGWLPVALFVAWVGSILVSNFTSDRIRPTATLLVTLVVQHTVMSITEVFGCINPSWGLAMIMLPLIAIRLRPEPPVARPK